MTETPELIAEQLRHNFDLIRAELDATKDVSTYEKELLNLRLAALEKCSSDFEDRLRKLQESSTQFKLLVSLATGGGLLSLISLLRELFK